MAQKSKIKLTNDELNLICSTQYPYLKKSAMAKLAEIFQEIAKQNLALFEELNPDNQLNSKLSSGENFLDCPWLVMDIPQIKKNNYPFGARIFFRWSQHFVLQFFIQKDFLDASAFLNLAKKCTWDCRVLTSGNLWENCWEASGFRSPNEIEPNLVKSYATETNYYKVVASVPIKKSDELPELSTGFFAYWLNGIKSASQ